MTRRCSHCSNNGHNSRTCPSRGGRASIGSGGGGGLKLFGVRVSVTDGIMKKSASMGNLSAHYHCSSSAAASPNPDSPSYDPVHEPDGYLSDDPGHASCSANRNSERKKGIPWTEEEHRLFLRGLQKLGKGDWRGIARNYVISRTPTQVASHAQKYYIRQSNATRRKRRSSLFDMAPDMTIDPPPVPEDQVVLAAQSINTDNSDSLPSLNLSLNLKFEPMETTTQENVEEPDKPKIESTGFTPMVPQFFPAYIPLQIWAPSAFPIEEEEGATHHHEVLKPIPILPKEPVNVDELVGMSQLTLGGQIDRSHREPSPLSLQMIGESSRQSAFHPNAPSKGKSNAIQAV